MRTPRRLSPVPDKDGIGKASTPPPALRAQRRSANSTCGAERKPVRAPDLVELRAFCAAVDLGSIGSAARLLYVSQPALSKRLRVLEAVAGAELLHRSTRGVSPTAAGADLYVAARRLLDEADAVDSLMSGFTARAPPIRIAADPTIAETWLPEALADHHRHAQRHLAVEVVAANSTVVRRMIQEGRSDLGFAEVHPDRPRSGAITERMIWRDEVIVAVPRDHAWAQASEIEPAEFAGTPVIRRDPDATASQIVDRGLRRAGLSAVTPLGEIGSTGAAVRIALAQCAPALLSESGLRDQGYPGLVVRRVRGIRFEQRFALIFAGWVSDLAPPARALARHLLARRDRATSGDAGR